MPCPVSLTDLATLLGDEAADPALLESALSTAADLFSRACGRHERPFALEASAREETHDGTGTRDLYLDYPIATLTSVLIGPDPDEPVETLAIDDKQVLRYQVGKRRLVRINGVFGCAGDPLVVHVTYDTASDLPEIGRRAILNAAAILYRRGAPDGSSGEQLGEYNVTYGAGLEQDPAWLEAVRVCAESVIA